METLILIATALVLLVSVVQGMETLLPFKEVGYVSDGAFESEFKQGAIAELVLSFDGGHTGGTPASAADAAPWPLLGVLELEQNGPRIKMNARSLYHLAAFYNGGYPVRTAQVSASGKFASRFSLPLQKMMEGAGLDATGTPVAWRGQFRAVGYYSGTAPTSIDTTSKLRPLAITAEAAPAGGFRDPEFSEENVDCSSAALDRNRKIDFNSDFLLPGIGLLALNADGGSGTDASGAVDGLARRVTIEILRPGQAKQEVCKNVPWGVLRYNTVRLAGWSAADEVSSQGFVFVPFFKRRGGRFRDAEFLPRGSSIIVTIDTTSDVEAGFSAVTPASNDVVTVILPKFHAPPKAAQDAAPTDVVSRVRAREGGGRRAFVG